MPRTGKGQVAPGETYGHRQELEAQMDAAPMEHGHDLQSRAVEGATQMPPPPPGGILKQPSTRPNEPATSGLPVGAGPGPEALAGQTRRQDHLRQQLQLAAEMTGNTRLRQMATRIHPPVR